MQLKKSDIYNRFDVVIIVPDLCTKHLFDGMDKLGYTAGAAGWNADVFTINGAALVSGYRPFGTVRAPYELTREYETRAQKIYNDRRIKKYETRADHLYKLAAEYVKKVMEG